MSKASSESQEVRTLAEKVFQQLQEAIVRGEIPSGSKITEPGLAEVYGISRGPLREAMRRLETYRLIEREPHVGARVVQLSVDELLELFDLREAMESMAARLAARHMTPDEVCNLKSVLSQHEKQQDIPSQEAYFQRQGDMDFHYLIAHGSHNRMLIRLLCDDLYYLVRLYRTQFSSKGDRFRRAYMEHQRITEAIEAGDEELSELLMKRHIVASRKAITEQYANALSAQELS